MPHHRSVNKDRPDGFSVEDVVAAYDAEASRLTIEYERFSFDEIHSAVLDLVPDTPGFVLDIGAGTGRDAAWFADKGYTVVAVEPSTELRKAGQERHRSSNIQWMNDAMPKLEQVFSSKLTFDLVWLSGVWMHVPKTQRDQAFRKIVSVLRPGGSVMLSIRVGPQPEGRPMDQVTVAEVETLAQRRGLQIVRVDRIRDALQRPEISWDVVWLRFPDDGTGALPLLRHIVFNDSKSSTYKLALLRTLIRAADSAGGFARLSQDEQHMELPLGLISLFWVRGFQPLLANDLPQHPAGNSGLSFVKEGFQGLASRSPYDLRVGQTFSGQDAANLIRALRDAANCIRRMPANFITYPGSSGSEQNQVFPCEYRSVQISNNVRIDEEFLWAFGTFSVPVHVWQAMSRYAPWIEPAVVSEWIEVMRGYKQSNAVVTQDQYLTSLKWLDPERDTTLVRKLGENLRADGHRIYCVWTGNFIRKNFDVDHCMPYAAWPCNDLWNLLPSLPRINRSKGNCLPAPEALENAKPRILEWWSSAYLREPDLARRFEDEARSALPAVEPVKETASPENLENFFQGVMFQQMVLKRDQQLVEWHTPNIFSR